MKMSLSWEKRWVSRLKWLRELRRGTIAKREQLSGSWEHFSIPKMGKRNPGCFHEGIWESHVKRAVCVCKDRRARTTLGPLGRKDPWDKVLYSSKLWLQHRGKHFQTFESQRSGTPLDALEKTLQDSSAQQPEAGKSRVRWCAIRKWPAKTFGDFLPADIIRS